MPFYLTC